MRRPTQPITVPWCRAILALAAPLLVSCTPDNPRPSFEPIVQQIQQAESDLKIQRFSSLLTFESDTDAIFTIASPNQPTIDSSRAHSGHNSLMTPAGTDRLQIKLGSLLSGRQFPGNWTLVGGYLYSAESTQVVMRYHALGQPSLRRAINLAPNRWTPLFLDISALPAVASAVTTQPASGDSAMLDLEFPTRPGGPVYLDDVTLIDNSESFITPDDTTPLPLPGGPTWTIRRRGFHLLGDSSAGFKFDLATPEEKPTGWHIDTACPMRASFSSTDAKGRAKTLTIYVDGRAYWDGVLKPMTRSSDEQDYAAAHQSPAELAVPEDLGRVDRASPGDANNDGYNESRGSYEIIADGARIEVRITPRVMLLRPVIEIAGLPPGNVLATVDGQLVDRTTRLPDNHLLVEIPARIDHPVTLNVRLQ